MKTILFTLALLTYASLPALAEEHAHHGAASASLELDAGKKWETDAPLRAGMSAIRDALAAKLGEIHEKKLKKAQYVELSEKILEQTNSIFKNCKLAPKADAQLHQILVPILEGNQRMKSGKSLNDRRAGAIKILGALEQYPKFFDHPGWEAIQH